MRTLLLLAGHSRRFWPLAEKSLFPICGKTLAEHQVETLRKGGCRDITLVVGAHNKERLKKLFPGFPVIEQKNLDLGMQGACLSALPKIKHGPIMIVSGNDAIESIAFDMLRNAASKPKTDGAILARKVRQYFPGGYLTVKNGKIASIVEKPPIDTIGALHAKSMYVNIVAHIHNDPTVVLAALKNAKSHRDDGYERALQTVFRERKYHAVPYTGFWQPVKYSWHLIPLLEHFLSGIVRPAIHSTVNIHPSSVVEGNVVIGEGTRVLPHATIVGPCVIGRRCIIGNNALVRGSSIGDDCVIGYNTEVKGAILAGPVWTHMTYLGDSVIGKNVSFGGGCITGNLRLDEKEILSGAFALGAMPSRAIPTGLTKFGVVVGDNCRIGIHVSANPGIKIGSGSFISSDVTLNKDIPESSFVDMKNGAIRTRRNSVAVPAMKTREKYGKKM